jgi:hypothetical protein
MGGEFMAELKEKVVTIWTGLIWLGTGASGGLF